MITWKTVRVFISSTFKDMHAERDYLVKHVFPELAQWCEERLIRFYDVDLRWGVTTDEEENENAVTTCLDSIDDCRPFFLCFLGQRRGWIPFQRENDIQQNMFNTFPQIVQSIRRSITEIEIEHALLAPMLRIVDHQEVFSAPTKHALFFFRNDPFQHITLTNEYESIYKNAETDRNEADRELERFKAKIQAKWPVQFYDCKWNPVQMSPELSSYGNVAVGRLHDFSVNGISLKECVLDMLKRAIGEEFPDHLSSAPEDIFQKDILDQTIFGETAREGYVMREDNFEALDQYLAGDEKRILSLISPEGCGKTTLLAAWAKHLDEKNIRHCLRFCGMSDLAYHQSRLANSIGKEINWDWTMPENSMHNPFKKLFAMIENEGICVIILDGISAIENWVSMLFELAMEKRDSIKIVVSINEKEYLKAVADKKEFVPDMAQIHIKPFNTIEEKKRFIDTFLNQYLKKMDSDQMKVFCSLSATDNPLYMKVLLHELKVFGVYEQLSDEILRYGETLETAFSTVLHRLENDAVATDIDPSIVVPLLFGLLAFSRTGLSEDELIFCIEQITNTKNNFSIQEAVRVHSRQMRIFMMRRQNIHYCLYDSFVEAIKTRYVKDEPMYHRLLADTFVNNARLTAKQPAPTLITHGNVEVLYHLEIIEDWDGIFRCLTDREIFDFLSPFAYRSRFDRYEFLLEADDTALGNNKLLSYLQTEPEGVRSDEQLSFYQSIFEKLAHIMLQRAADEINKIMKYPQPYNKTAENLQEEKNGTYAVYCNHFFAVCALAEASLFFFEQSISNRKDWALRFKRYREQDKGVFTFMHYLENFGESQAGLPYRIEVFANETRQTYVKLSNAIRVKETAENIVD